MISTIAAFLKSGSTWVYIVTVAGFLVYGSYQELKLNRAEKTAAEWQTRAETAEGQVRAMKDKLEALNIMLEEQTKALDTALAKRAGKKKAVADAKRKDKQVADWSNSPVPDGVRGVFQSKRKKH